MKKILLILSFILFSVFSFAQRQRTTAVFDSDTTTRPKVGFFGIGIRANNIYFVPRTGNNIRLANYSLFTGLTTNYLTKWDGTKLSNSLVLDNGTNIGIGTSPSFKLDISGDKARIFSTNNPHFAVQHTTNNVISKLQSLTSSGMVGTESNHPFEIRTNNITKIHVSESGSVGIGSTSLTGINLRIGKTLTGAASSTAIQVDGVIQSDVTTGAYHFNSIISTQAASFTLPYFIHYAATQSTIGASSTLTAQYGFYVSSGMIGATNNYGFRGVIASGSGRWNIYMDGTAQNHIRGQIVFGTNTTAVASAAVEIVSTTQGFLPPRMTTTQINAISSPANGLMVYNTTLNKICVYENGTWKQVTTTNM